MNTIEGDYFDGYRPIAIQGTMAFMDRTVTLSAGLTTAQYTTDDLKVSPRIGTTSRFIILPGGGQFGCADNALLDSLPQESKTEGIVAWLEQRWMVALACVAVISLLMVLGYFFGLPAAAKRIAYRIPMETERSLGNQTLKFLDEKNWLKPTNLPIERQKEISEKFYQLCEDLPLKKYFQLEFRQGGVFRSNAMAFPGGIIVITDEMVDATEGLDEVIAVLAHEAGHVELRHTMRSVLQNSAIGVIVATITSDAATLSAAITGLPVILAQTKYSRDFETAADDYAFRLLMQNGYSPAAFASIMERLSKDKPKDMGPPTWIDTHPVTSERIKRARDAAKE